MGAFGIFVVARALGGEVGYHQTYLAIRTNIQLRIPQVSFSHCASAIGYSLLPLALSKLLVRTGVGRGDLFHHAITLRGRLALMRPV